VRTELGCTAVFFALNDEGERFPFNYAKLSDKVCYLMHDPRFDKLASLLVSFSTALKKGERALIDAFDIPPEMTIALVRAVRNAGALPFVQLHQGAVSRELAMHAAEAALDVSSNVELARMKKMDAYIAVRGGANITEMSDVPPEQMKLVARKMKPVLDWRVKKTRWCVLRWPSPSMAQLAGMSTEAFEKFYFDVCTLNYAKMVPGMKALKTLMEKTDKVHLRGPGVDLTFSIKGIAAIPCGGGHNIPDGEVFTAPVKNSVEGYIAYNAPTIYQGTAFDNVRLVFKAGRIVEATANNTLKLNEILDSDPGARYIGEFAIAFNPHILKPMRDILFDEKISGSFHFTPGQCYEQTENGNRSQVHWDMVSIQRPDWGGGTIHFDGKLIREDGRFVPKSLHGLNPENLV
jgi:aminopeptidase